MLEILFMAIIIVSALPLLFKKVNLCVLEILLLSCHPLNNQQLFYLFQLPISMQIPE
jgi:hypothetical protein